MTHKKITLATKDCIVCNRPFAWRKKWERCWQDVKYCSEKCRRNKDKLMTKQSQKNDKKS